MGKKLMRNWILIIADVFGAGCRVVSASKPQAISHQGVVSKIKSILHFSIKPSFINVTIDNLARPSGRRTIDIKNLFFSHPQMDHLFNVFGIFSVNCGTAT